MPIKPMDMQVLLPNVQRAAKPGNVKNATQEMASQQQQVSEAKNLQQQKQKVSHTKGKDKSEIKNDEKKHPRDEKDKKKKKKKDDENKPKMRSSHGSKFDMKV